jgi:sensor histidine kinase YesM
MIEKIAYNNILLEIVISKKWRIVRHILMIVLLALFFYPKIDPTPFYNLGIKNVETIISGIRMISLAMYILSIGTIYLNLLFFVPRYLMKNKYGLYFVYNFFLAIVYFLIEYFVTISFVGGLSEYLPSTDFSFKSFLDSALIPFVFLSATAGYQVFKKWIRDTALLSEMREAKIQEELRHLKNQINPHFLFNTLNNLNTLITVDANKATAVVLGLSDVLRYQLYEANDDKVLLKKDIEILERYLELEKIRRDNFQFSINVEGDIMGVLIPPFIFINFVENAIKHSVDNQGFSYIALQFSSVNNYLQFTCKNSKPSIIKAKVNGGLGLKNIKRRLELIYSETFSLDINDNTKEFLIQLTLPI